MSIAWRWRAAGCAFAAGCFALCTAHAAGAPVRMPRSTLVSKPQLPFALEREQRGSERIDTLLYKPATGEPLPVAVLSVAPAGVTLRRLPLPAENGDLEVATAEHLYVLVMQEEPDARYCIGEAEVPCDATKGTSHGDLLRQLVELRKRAKPSVPWQVVSMEPPPGRRPDADYVAVRLSVEGKPLVGGGVFFNRAPHSSCSAKTDRLGRAGCKLVDQHGHEGAHGDEDHAAVTVIYSGDVRPERVLVPTTYVLRRKPR
jgi:hypothetical protein